MLRNLNSLLGSVINAVDGNLGHIHDFLFDDRGWTVRYLVVETGNWLSSRQVLISPSSAGPPDWEKRVVPVSLTMEQVRNSPDVDTATPVSLQEEIAMSQYYGWPAYWSMDPPLVPVMIANAPNAVVAAGADPHLRSVKEVITYQVQAADGELGNIDDLIMEDSTWYIRYLVANTGSWLNGQKLLLATRWVGSILWSQQQVILTHSREDL